MPLDYDRLAQVPALAGFTPEEFEAFFAICQRVTAKAGDRIVRQGEAANSFYLVARGSVEVVVDAGGRPLPVAQLGRGHLVGEMPLIYHQPVRQADVVALEECHLFCWAYSDYDLLAQSHPELVKKFRSNLGRIAAGRAWTAPLAPAAPEPAPAAPVVAPPPPDIPPVARDSAVAILKQATTFTGFTDDELREVETISELLTVRPDHTVCKAGDPADSFYVVVKGQAEVQIDKAGKLFPLARLGPGQVFGEMALIYKQPTRSATVTATEPSKFLRIGFADYERLVATSPEIGRKLKGNLSRVAASRSWSLPETDEARALKERAEPG